MRHWTGWTAFALWSVAGALLVFSFLTGFSIGIFIFPFALLATLLAARFASGSPEAIGVVAGAGAVALLIGFLNRDYNPCPESGVLTVPPGETSVECGGFDPVPWLVAGISLVVVALAAYAFVRRWGKTPPGVG